MDGITQIGEKLACGALVRLVRGWPVWLGVAFLLAGCGVGEETAVSDDGTPAVLTIFAASSLTDAFDELAGAFEDENPSVTVRLNFAGSSQLALQLLEGAEADLFASANEAQMSRVVENGRIVPEAVQPLATNGLIIIVPSDNPAGVTSLADLGKADVALVLATEGVPIRGYTDALVAGETAVFQERFYANVVSEEENVRQVVAKILLGEAEAGIVYRSDVSNGLAEGVVPIELPEETAITAVYPIAPLADAPEPDWAAAFMRFVQGETGQAILARWGLGAVP